MENFYSKNSVDTISEQSSGGSTPEPTAPFIQKYCVKFTDKVIKNGDAVQFTIQVLQNDIVLHAIERIYEDFEYLEHCVITDQPSHGLIIPPLPQLVAVDVESAVAYSKKHMGKGFKHMLGDDFKKDCLQLQKYVNFLLCHPVLGQSPRLQEFLLNKKAPPRTKIRKGIINKISSSFEARKISYPDCEDFFQKERDILLKYLPSIQQFSNQFERITFAQIKILHQLELMTIALRLNPNLKNGPISYFNLNNIFFGCIERTKNELEDKIVCEDMEAGCKWNIWKEYVSAEESMLLVRTSLMIDYQTSNRALDKAKPNRKHIAEKAQKNCEEAFERCSDVARKEIKRFQMLKTNDLLKTVSWYMHHQISSTKRSIDILSATLANIKAIPTP